MHAATRGIVAPAKVGSILPPNTRQDPLSPVRHVGSGMAQGGPGLAHSSAATIPDGGASSNETRQPWPGRGVSRFAIP